VDSTPRASSTSIRPPSTLPRF